MKKKINYPYSFIRTFLWITLGISLGFLFYMVYNGDNYIFEREIINSTNCSGLDLDATAFCLNKELDSFYFYNISNQGKILSPEEFKSEGGVCSHASEYYKQRAEDLGFYAEYVTFHINSTNYHAVTVISNDRGYCFMDQAAYHCFGFLNASDVAREPPMSYALCADTCKQNNMTGYVIVKGVCQCIKPDLECVPSKLGTIALECMEVL